jgi:alanine-glyoxylate transaminase/serine-glyoxylate transaminase/serine-pyruvate transaminase
MLASGRPYLAIPGPSVMPDAVLNAMHRAAPNIYTGELIEMTAGLIPDLKAVARTAHHATIYIGNGHAAWEASLANVLSRGDLVLVPATGRFGLGWAEMARGLGVEVEVIDFGPEAAWDLGRIEERLAADPDGRIKAVLAVHVDTSSSVKNDVAGLRAVLDRLGHPALLMADCIASLGCDQFEMDLWGADVMVAASQKGLMVPPGMCFVFFNDRADKARERADCVTRYWDWRPRANPEEYWQYFDGTAPTHHLYGLRVALDMIKAEGIENVWRRHEVLAQAIWAAFDAWSVKGPVRLNVGDPALRSWAVTSAHAGSPDAARLRDWCERVAGLTLGIGLGRTPADAWFRIGHMGHVSAPMILGALGTIEAGLQALQIPHGTGGVAAAAEVVAGA